MSLQVEVVQPEPEALSQLNIVKFEDYFQMYATQQGSHSNKTKVIVRQDQPPKQMVVKLYFPSNSLHNDLLIITVDCAPNPLPQLERVPE